MKILWLCNIPLPHFADALGIKTPPQGGWLSGLLGQLKNNDELHITVCFPLKGIKAPIIGEADSLHFFAFPRNSKKYSSYFLLCLQSRLQILSIYGGLKWRILSL